MKAGASEGRRGIGAGPIAVATTAFLLLLAHAPAVLGGRVWVLKDILLWFYPAKLLLRRRLLAGDLPHWGPELGLGAPLLADPGFSVLYPPNLALALPEPGCVTVFLWLHLAVGALGAMALARRAGVGWASASFAGLAFALGGYCTSMLWTGTYLLGLVWTPGILAAVDRLLDRPGFRSVAIVAALWGSQLASGEQQAVLLTGVVAGAWALARPLPEGARPAPTRARWIGAVAVGVVASVALAAAQFLPYLTLFAHSERQSGLSLAEAQHWSLHPIRLVETLFPHVFGDLNESGSFFAYALDNEGGRWDRWPWMSTPYPGVVTVLLAAAALGARPAQRRFAGFWAGVLAVTTLLSLGRFTPLFALWFRVVPLANAFRYPAKYWMGPALALPVLAAIGLDALLAGEARARRAALAATLGALVVAAAFAASAAPIARDLLELAPAAVDVAADAMRETALVGTLVPVLAGALVLFAGRASARGARVAALAAAALGAVDLWLRVVLPVPHAAADALAPPAWLAQAGARPGTRVWAEVGDVDLAGPSSPLSREAAARAEVLAVLPNTGLVFGLGQVNQYSSVKLRDDRRFWRAAEAHLDGARDAFGVELVVRDPATPPTPGLAPFAKLPAAGVEVLRNERALPAAYYARDAIGAADDAAAAALLDDPRVRAGSAVVIEGAAAPVAQNEGATPPPGACRAEPAGDGDDLRVACDAAAPGWAVVSTAFDWGWRAEVDGAPAEIRRANGRGMALAVPAGRHDVALRYREPWFAAGLATTIAAALVLAIGAVIEARRAGRRIRS